MLAASLCVACVSIQAHSARIFGRKLTIFSIAVAAILLGSFAFLPILSLLIWLTTVAVVLIRRDGEANQTHS